jgi:hypothetical protein
LRSEPSNRPARRQALAVAEWLYLNYLTEDKQQRFMIDTGWELDPAMGDEFYPMPPLSEQHDDGQDDMPF